MRRRDFAPGALALVVAALAAACADGPVAPAAPAGGAAFAAGTSSSSGTSTTTSGSTSTSSSSSSTSTSSGGTATVMMTITPTTNATFTVNRHRVQIVPGSVCDPATSGYGPSLWDAPCVPAKSTITVTAKAWTSSTGRPMITFSPDLRFVPGKVNTIWLLDPTAAARKAGVLAWCPTGSSTCVDESRNDPSLVTRYTTDGYAYRRLKHFSGYTIAMD